MVELRNKRAVLIESDWNLKVDAEIIPSAWIEY